MLNKPTVHGLQPGFYFPLPLFLVPFFFFFCFSFFFLFCFSTSSFSYPFYSFFSASPSFFIFLFLLFCCFLFFLKFFFLFGFSFFFLLLLLLLFILFLFLLLFILFLFLLLLLLLFFILLHHHFLYVPLILGVFHPLSKLIWISNHPLHFIHPPSSFFNNHLYVLLFHSWFTFSCTLGYRFIAHHLFIHPHQMTWYFCSHISLIFLVVQVPQTSSN